MAPGDIGEEQLNADASGSPDGPTDGAIVSIVDEDGDVPRDGDPIEPPPSTQLEPPITEEPSVVPS